MSQPSSSSISLISQDGVANVDISNVFNIQDTLQYLLNTVNALQQEVSTHTSVIAELSALRTENASLKSKIATLEAQLASSSSPSGGQSPLAKWSSSFCWISLSSESTSSNLHGRFLFVCSWV
ncbi:hypothetical protein G6F57_013828 [Rhizopus arrhizus]|uniref:Uncharacterized protein n=1 Tax=Rhizopus oryzae TaxID=64495 RepID=A0A9P6WXJ4_RHIOR|nr:hypothetical protein G6F23_012528 [Rhizopus arrhizus]KAG0757345.1 hypothetical protein G6F24_010542 [Rhizopus arrhizus]KAG0779496.1 hypothetical protein G6F21_012556 [Rhizopus arrhizus]KAG0821487.1 hypothetical protein G6F18_012175 [Rhizopus arrhizus]KAG0838639.1 hypothetical protein G6F19_003030 [Rhizopus arrhizus]